MDIVWNWAIFLNYICPNDNQKKKNYDKNSG